MISYSFTTMDNPSSYSNVNRLLGINNEGSIVGISGSGVPSDPSVGYNAIRPYAAANYQSVVYPMAGNTFATAINDTRMVAGYYVANTGKTYGFLLWSGLWWSYQDPHCHAPGATTEITGIDNDGNAVGNYKAPNGSGAFQVNVTRERYRPIAPPGGTKVVATGINGTGDIVGYMNLSGKTVGFIEKKGVYTDFSYPGATSTKFLGVAIHDYVVGIFTGAHGGTHGFLLISPLWKRGTTWQQIDDPNGLGTTVVTGVNMHQTLIGYYVDTSGITHGFLAAPKSGDSHRP